MTRTPYDQFSKQYLEELLTPLSKVDIGREVPGEARQVDVLFSPAPQSTANPQILGLLGRFAASPCLLELSIEASENLDEEDQAIIMQLSPLYLQRLEEAQREGRQAGMQVGVQTERRTTLESLLRLRFGSLDDQLSAVIEPLVQLSTEDYARLLLQLSNLSREDLLARFEKQSG